MCVNLTHNIVQEVKLHLLLTGSWHARAFHVHLSLLDINRNEDKIIFLLVTTLPICEVQYSSCDFFTKSAIRRVHILLPTILLLGYYCRIAADCQCWAINFGQLNSRGQLRRIAAIFEGLLRNHDDTQWIFFTIVFEVRNYILFLGKLGM